VDSRGQGGLLREYRDATELDGVEFSSFDAIAITGGGDVLLIGNLKPGGVDWDAIRAICKPERYQRGGSTQYDRIGGGVLFAAEKSTEPVKTGVSVESIIERMQPNASETPRPTEAYASIAAPTASAPIAAITIPKPESAPSIVNEALSAADGIKREETDSAVHGEAPDIAPVEPITITERVVPNPEPKTAPDPLTELVALLSALSEETIRAMTDALKATKHPAAETAAWITFQAAAPKTDVSPAHSSAAPAVPPKQLEWREASATAEPIKPPDPPDPTEPSEPSEPARPKLNGTSNLMDSAVMFHRPAAETAAVSASWPVWGAYCKPVWDWPDEAADLREVFERGSPSDDVSMPGWTFVRAPCALSGEESLLGVMVEGDRVTKTAVLYRGSGSGGAEPPAGLAGYTYDCSLGAGYWVRWRDYGKPAAVERPAV
jgi:hypothetical protein